MDKEIDQLRAEGRIITGVAKTVKDHIESALEIPRLTQNSKDAVRDYCLAIEKVFNRKAVVWMISDVYLMIAKKHEQGVADFFPQEYYQEWKKTPYDER